MICFFLRDILFEICNKMSKINYSANFGGYMRDKKYAGIIASIFVVAITGFTIWGTGFFGASNAGQEEKMDVAGAEGIKEAFVTKDNDGNVTGYKVVAVTKGFEEGAEIVVSFEADGKTIASMELGENKETPGIGSQLGDAAYTATLQGVAAPVQLKGTNGTGSEIDGVTGATLTSGAVVDGINKAFDFVQTKK